jgi:hypothetical protein
MTAQTGLLHARRSLLRTRRTGVECASRRICNYTYFELHIYLLRLVCYTCGLPHIESQIVCLFWYQ